MRFDPEGFGPLGEPFLVVPLDGTEPPPPAGTLPCPVIGLGDTRHPNAAACDLTVPDAAALAPVLAAIRAAPIAAAVLVQVLRMTEKLSLHEALVLESLAYATLQNGAENRAWLAARAPVAAPPREAGPPVVLERDGDVLAIRLNRPAGRNEITVEMRDALVEAFEFTELDVSIAQVTLEGAGKCFSIGGALAEFGTAPDQATAHAVRCMRGPAFALAPVRGRVQARVHGACIGAGAELASLCAHVSASACTFFQLPELRYGLIPGAGGTAGFARRIGRQRTAWMAITGARVGASKAMEWGLVDEVREKEGSVLF